MSKRAELDALARVLSEAVLDGMPTFQRQFFEQDPAAAIDLDVWIGQEASRAIARIAKKAKPYYRKWRYAEE